MDSSTENATTIEPMREPWDWHDALIKFLIVGTVFIVVLLLARLAIDAIVFRGYWLQAAPLLPVMEWLLVGLTALVLCAAAVFLVHLHRTVLNHTRSMDQRLAALAEQAFNQAQHASNAARRETNPELVEVRRLLGDIREIMLLPDAQRQARFRSMMQAELEQRLALTNRFIEAREFHRARTELASLVERFGRTGDITKIEEHLRTAVNSAMAADVEEATRRAADLMITARWEQAEQYARELTQKYPDAVEPRNLLARVREERVMFARRHRQRMHDEIQQFVNERRWREAASAAENFVHTFPVGVDTDALRQQLETLKANAEIEIRQHLERHIKEHLSRKDYWAALELGRRIISEYPFSPQANILRMQLPKLEELARQLGPRA